MSLGNRGKGLEADIKDFLKEKSKVKEFTYYRYPDVRTCGKGVGKQPADYIIFQKGRNPINLDPKELKGSQRLNIKSRCSQRPKMNRMKMAGVDAYFLIHQTDDDLYYVVSVGFVNDLVELGEKSIKLSELKIFDNVEVALEAIIRPKWTDGQKAFAKKMLKTMKK
jgi:penicillin-binding protein-related factor A (putative recombinase)